MRAFGFSVLSAGALLGTLLFGSGCYSLSGDCELNFNCDGSGGGGTGGDGGGGGGGAPPGCVPSNNSSPVDDSCGVFVSSSKGEDSNVGTKEKPFATVAMAFNSAPGKPVYLCGEEILESVEVGSNIQIFGALDCDSDWKYDPAKQTVLTASNDMTPLRIGSKKSVSVYDVILRAEDALIPGGSSIAVIAEGESTLSLTRCRVEAGNGANGADGDELVDTAFDGQAGADGLNACVANQVITPDPPTTTCGEVQSIGGLGGIGTQAQGGAGTPGLPDGSMNGGAGEGLSLCTDGLVGNAGVTGMPGSGGTGLGALQAGLGFVPSAGGDGQPGTPGQGGGGGGGAKGGTGSGKCPAGSTGGASGGTGGTGGCGGQGGKGGKGGGASIGIVSVGATLEFSDVVVQTKAGGKGGNGGLGQLGGEGGPGGLGGSKINFINLNNACAGGTGGKGGDGGRGGGGRGGHSIGIAHIAGGAPDMTGVSVTPGTPGNGGTGDGDTGMGAAGLAVQLQEF